MTKAHLRKQMRRRRNSLNVAERLALGHQWCQRIAGHPSYINSTSFAAYWPLRGELDTRPLMALAHRQGKAVFLPAISGTGMWFGQWNGALPDLNRTCGLRQPAKKTLHLSNRRMLDFVIVPMLAFDRCGTRLGQGGGFYDHYFRQQRDRNWRRPLLVGAAYEFQEVANVPSEIWDVPLNLIVTNEEIIVTANNKGTVR